MKSNNSSEINFSSKTDKKRFIIVGFGISPEGTMGGNTKIALEIARNLAHIYEVYFVVPSNKINTLSHVLNLSTQITVISVLPYKRKDIYHLWGSSKHFTSELKKVFTSLSVDDKDIVYSASDFHIDTIPCKRLKSIFNFRWIAVQFLFVPSPIENLIRHYHFPLIKYTLVWIYSFLFFKKAQQRADAFVITNDDDRKHFPQTFQKNIFAFYGGVNVEEIDHDKLEKSSKIITFCSRLHPQKGIYEFLDIWRSVINVVPNCQLYVIGNGTTEYEAVLKLKAKKLGLEKNINWLGYVNGMEKYKIYHRARAHVHPTIYDNNGMVAAEALCSGLPVVMYDIPSLQKVYTVGCVKVPFGNKQAFANVLIKILTNDTYCASIKPTSVELEELKQKWDWENRTHAFCAWLKKVFL